MHDAPVVAQQRGFLTPPPNRMLYLPLLLCLLRLLTEPVVRGSAPESSQKQRAPAAPVARPVCLQASEASEATPPKDANWRRLSCIRFPTTCHSCNAHVSLFRRKLRPGEQIATKRWEKVAANAAMRQRAHLGLSEIFPGLRSLEGHVCAVQRIRHFGTKNTNRPARRRN